jgi:hypothetical protein
VKASPFPEMAVFSTRSQRKTARLRLRRATGTLARVNKPVSNPASSLANRQVSLVNSPVNSPRRSHVRNIALNARATLLRSRDL